MTATGTVTGLTPLFNPTERKRQVQDDMGEHGEGISPNDQIKDENQRLRGEIRILEKEVQQLKHRNQEIYKEFAEKWDDAVNTLKVLDEKMKKHDEKIAYLEQLLEQNEEMRKVIEFLKQRLSEFEEKERKLKVGQIAYQLENLVSEYVFPGNDDDSIRARYGTKLKSVRKKIENDIEHQTIKEKARERVQKLDKVMFKRWFLDMLSEVQKERIGTAHPKLDSYEEMVKLINEEFEVPVKRKDMLAVLNQLKNMYERLQRPFGD